MGTISMQHFIYNSPFHDDWDSKFARSTGSYLFLNDVEAPEDARTPKVYPESGNVIKKTHLFEVEVDQVLIVPSIRMTLLAGFL